MKQAGTKRCRAEQSSPQRLGTFAGEEAGSPTPVQTGAGGAPLRLGAASVDSSPRTAASGRPPIANGAASARSKRPQESTAEPRQSPRPLRPQQPRPPARPRRKTADTASASRTSGSNCKPVCLACELKVPVVRGKHTVNEVSFPCPALRRGRRHSDIWVRVQQHLFEPNQVRVRCPEVPQ